MILYTVGGLLNESLLAMTSDMFPMPVSLNMYLVDHPYYHPLGAPHCGFFFFQSTEIQSRNCEGPSAGLVSLKNCVLCLTTLQGSCVSLP